MPKVSRRSKWILAAIIGLFLAGRVPVILRQAPAQDEDYFAVPGWTILHEGIPRIPYMPARDPKAAFYKADKVLYALPPLYFYWEALFYLVLGPETSTARLASTAAGMAAVVLLFALARRLFDSEAAGCWAAGGYAFSRVVYFPCLMARPDMLCGALGIGAIFATWNWQRSRQTRWVVVAGVLVGAGMLTHPFAVIFVVQTAAWLLVCARDWRQRVRSIALFGALSGAVFLLWVPLILIEPDAFRSQFFNNVLDRTGPGILSRFIQPGDAFRIQIPLFIEHVGRIQAGLMVAATVVAGVVSWRSRKPSFRTAVFLAVSGVYLHIVCQGTHPTKGYWCYTGALMFVCAGGVIAAAQTRLVARFGRTGLLTALGVLAMGAALLPGSGVRTLAAHLRHWSDINYDAPRFTRQLIAQTDPDDQLVVDPAWIFDFHRAGRSSVLALNFKFFFDVTEFDYDQLVAGPTSRRDGVAPAMEAVFARSIGDREEPFACYAELYSAPPHRRPERGGSSSALRKRSD